MGTYLDVDLENVEVGFKLPPAGDYKATIESFDIRHAGEGDARKLKDVQFNYLLIEGHEDGQGLTIKDFIDPASDMGKKKLKALCIACGITHEKGRLELDKFTGQSVKLTVVHKKGKNEGSMFANVNRVSPLEVPESASSDDDE